MLSAEDGLADTIRPRLDAAEGDPGRVDALTAVRAVTDAGEVVERPPTLADMAAIRGAILRTRAVLVVVDVLMAYLPGKVDSHRDQDVRAVLSRLTALGEETGCTFLLLATSTRPPAARPCTAAAGRSASSVPHAPDTWWPATPTTRTLACWRA